MPSRTFFCRSIKEKYPPCIILLDFKRDYAASSMKAPRRLDFLHHFQLYRYIPTSSQKPLINHISEFSGWTALSIGENPMKSRAVVFEFFACRQTDRRSGGLCFIICIDLVHCTLFDITTNTTLRLMNKVAHIFHRLFSIVPYL